MTGINERVSGRSDLRSAGPKRTDCAVRLLPETAVNHCHRPTPRLRLCAGVIIPNQTPPVTEVQISLIGCQYVTESTSPSLSISPSFKAFKPKLSIRKCLRHGKNPFPTQKFKEGNHTGFTETLIAETLSLSLKTFRHGLKAVPTSEDSSQSVRQTIIRSAALHQLKRIPSRLSRHCYGHGLQPNLSPPPTKRDTFFTVCNGVIPGDDSFTHALPPSITSFSSSPSSLRVCQAAVGEGVFVMGDVCVHCAFSLSLFLRFQHTSLF